MYWAYPGNSFPLSETDRFCTGGCLAFEVLGMIKRQLNYNYGLTARLLNVILWENTISIHRVRQGIGTNSLPKSSRAEGGSRASKAPVVQSSWSGTLVENVGE